MLYGEGLAALAELCLLVFCVLDVITTPEDRVRRLPKLLWLALVVFVPIVGSVAWLVAGRPTGPARSRPSRDDGGAPPARPSRASSPDDDAEFLEGLRRRAEEQRRRAKDDPPA